MSSSTSTFLSRDAVLHRQARFSRTCKNGTRLVPTQIPSSSTYNALHIIPEEDPLPRHISMTTPRAQRRHGLSAVPRGLRTTLEDIAEEAVPVLDFPFDHPLPPLPASSPSSSPPSSPDSQSTSLPLTPSTSDDDLPLPPSVFGHKRVSIKPLVINKIQRPSTLPIVDRSEESDFEEDSDLEWYTRDISKVVTLSSTLSSVSFPPPRRDSISIAPAFDFPMSPSPERRRRRSSGLRYSSFEAPPVPPIPSQFLSPKCTKTLSITASRRPPPRMSIPDDACSAFSLSLYTDDVLEPVSSPLSMYSQDSACTGIRQSLEDDVEDIEFPAGFEVQMDGPMMLPLSLPGTPIDLEADIASGLEELWMKENVEIELPKPIEPEGLGVGFILEENDEEEERVDIVTPTIVYTSPPPSPRTVPPLPPTATPVTPPRPSRSPASTISAFSFPPSPPSPSLEIEDFDERRYGLKSKWSSSTLSSVREEHASATTKFPGASKLKMYFQGQHKRNNSATPAPASPKFIKTAALVPAPAPASPVPVKTKTKEKKEKDAKRRSKRESAEGDVLVIGHTANSSPRRSHDSHPYSPPSPVSHPYRMAPTSPRRSRELPYYFPSPPRVSPTRPSHYSGLRRTPSQSSAGGVSDCGSDVSCTSAQSNWSDGPLGGAGLRRKPIPVEMFLRNGV